MEIFVGAYLIIGTICGVVGFAKIVPSIQPGHLVFALLAFVLIILAWPLWIVKAFLLR